jgi:hypothetical protein
MKAADQLAFHGALESELHLIAVTPRVRTRHEGTKLDRLNPRQVAHGIADNSIFGGLLNLDTDVLPHAATTRAEKITAWVDTLRAWGEHGIQRGFRVAALGFDDADAGTFSGGDAPAKHNKSLLAPDGIATVS